MLKPCRLSGAFQAPAAARHDPLSSSPPERTMKKKSTRKTEAKKHAVPDLPLKADQATDVKGGKSTPSLMTAATKGVHLSDAKLVV
jgi:hypothetical protein